MDNTYQNIEITGKAQRSIADQTASQATAYAAVPVLQKKSPEEELQLKSVAQLAAPEEELQMKSAVQMAKPEEEELQMKSAVQLAKPDEEELQMKSAVQLKSRGEDPLMQKKETPPAAANKTGMPDQLKTGVEQLSGIALDDVKVHYNSSQPAQLNALAYAQGTDIHVGPGQEKYLPHEAWHIVQQKQGRVQPTIQAKDVAINDDAGLEHEADVMGAKAIQ
jgi:hypothetical protein